MFAGVIFTVRYHHNWEGFKSDSAPSNEASLSTGAAFHKRAETNRANVTKVAALVEARCIFKGKGNVFSVFAMLYL